MSKRTLFLIFALLIITSVLVMITLYNPSPKTDSPVPAENVVKEPIEQTVLSFGNPLIATSSSTSVSYSLPANIETGANKVTAVQIELQYDPRVLTNVSIVPGSFFKNPEVLLSQIDAKTGRISYALGASLKDPGVSGKGTVTTIQFQTKAGIPQETSIIFLPKTLVTAEGLTQSVLKETTNSLLKIGEKPSTSSAFPID
ncbi:MAG: cohesin domain-containing protein [Candidatus Daviesbacteria bacterium]|nr:cohesin domain-containing protein [Candidatus Daviesbacteria bacterium]